MPVGIVAVKGNVYYGSPDELPVLVRHSNGHVDILDKPDSQSVAYGDFVVSGTAILVSQKHPRDTAGLKYVRPLDSVKRIALGLLSDGNIFVVYCTATLDKLKDLLCAYGVYDALLLASDNVYFNNPRSGITLGEQPVLSIQATCYEELPTPIIVIDPAHGGSDIGNQSGKLLEKDLTLTMAKHMEAYLKDKYHGTFLLTRNYDKYLSENRRIKLATDAQADFFYSCHINALNGLTRGFECQCYSDTPESVSVTLRSVHERLASNLSVQGIPDNGLHRKLTTALRLCECPALISKMLYLDNAEDINILMQPEMLRMLAHSQAEALAQALGLSKRTHTSTIPAAETARYKVNVGDFPFKLGAIELCEKLRQLGFDAQVIKE